MSLRYVISPSRVESSADGLGGRRFGHESPSFSLLPYWFTRWDFDEREQGLFPEMSDCPSGYAECILGPAPDDDIRPGIRFTDLHLALIQCNARSS